ncbi:unnamed protein product [Pieris macdunnoughi]|uniref:Uncharacterized protein n=1 Tax=Pieris macdunnoughi TaxID=345717 RepID=A0A821PQ06_9NEOP|nr:unnamed protein product [Pieris macdunnoughi]
MERAMLGDSLRDRIRNEEIHRRTKVTDKAKRAYKLRCQWVGYMPQWPMADGAKSPGPPRTSWRSVGRPSASWANDLVRVGGGGCKAQGTGRTGN